jgi:erythrin-vacuolar iron transport family protein
MPPLIDFSQLDLRGAFDLAIMIEEDAQMRYEDFARAFAEKSASAAAVFRDMAVNESKHRRELLDRRREVFAKDPPRIEISVMDEEGVERADLGELEDGPLTAREALEIALAAEVRAYEFYKQAIPYVKDVEVRKFFEDLAEEEVEHQQMLKKRLSLTP